MHQFKRSVFLLLLLVSGTPLRAQQVLTLAQCIQEALVSNRDMRIARFTPQLTEQRIRQTRSALLPQVSGSGQYQYYLQVPQQFIPTELFAGGTAPAGQPKYIAGTFTLPQSTTFSASLSQTLLDPALLLDLRVAQAARTSDKLEIRATQEDVAYNVAATYYNLQTQLRLVELQQGNLASNQRVLKSTESLVTNGLAAKTDYNKLVVKRANLLGQLRNARLSYRQSLATLKYLLGRALTDSLGVEPAEASRDIAPLLAADTTAGRSRASLLQLEQQRYVESLDRRRIRAGALPTLSLTGNYNLNAYNDRFNTFRYINGQWFGSSYLGLQLRLPVFDGFNRQARVRQADLRLGRFAAQIEQEKAQIAVDIANNAAAYASNLNTLRAQEENVALAQRVYQDTQVQYRNGLVRLPDVFTAEDDLREAQSIYLSAFIDLRTAELKLRQSRGELLN